MASLAGEIIYLEQDSGWTIGPRLAFLDILDSTETTIHELSTPSNRRNITATVKSDTGSYAALVAASRARDAVAFSSDEDSGTVIILNISSQRIQNVGDVIWRRFTAELMETS